MTTQTSNTIRLLRFPLAAFVIILHADLLDQPFERLGIFDLKENYPLYDMFAWSIGHYIGNCAVPCFFIISGYLLFCNVTNFTKDVYLKKLKTRAKTLLLPYIAWNIIYLLLFYFIGQDNILLSTVPRLYDGNISIGEFLYIAFVRPPADGPLWFVRNLMVMDLASPLFYYVIKKTKWVMPVSLLVVTQVWHDSFLLSFLWFSSGIYFAMYGIDFLHFCRKHIAGNAIICLFGFVFDLFLYRQYGAHFVSYYLYVFRIMLIFGAGYYIGEKHEKWSNIKILNESSFILYAYHGIPQQLILAAISKAFLPIAGGGVFVLDNFQYNYYYRNRLKRDDK